MQALAAIPLAALAPDIITPGASAAVAATPIIVKGAQKMGSTVNNFLHRKKKQQDRLVPTKFVAKGLLKKKIKKTRISEGAPQS